jgi:hypothetical protein
VRIPCSSSQRRSLSPTHVCPHQRGVSDGSTHQKTSIHHPRQPLCSCRVCQHATNHHHTIHHGTIICSFLLNQTKPNSFHVVQGGNRPSFSMVLPSIIYTFHQSGDLHRDGCFHRGVGIVHHPKPCIRRGHRVHKPKRINAAVRAGRIVWATRFIAPIANHKNGINVFRLPNRLVPCIHPNKIRSSWR